MRACINNNKIKKILNIFIGVRLLKTIEKIIQEAEVQYNSSVEKGLPLEEVDRLEENYRKSLKLMDMLETKKKIN
jgi:hypothetical protein